MSALQTLIFFGIVALITLSAHAYLARRILATSSLGRAGRRAVWALALVHGLAVPSLFPLMAYTGRPWADILQACGWVTTGIFAIFFFLMVFKDLLWWGALKIVDLGDRGGPLQDPERRAALARMLNGGVVAASLGIGGVGYVQAQGTAKVRRVPLPVKDLPPGLVGLKIAQISDIHVGPTLRAPEMAAIAEAVNALSPDLIMVTGDLVDGSVAGLREMVAPLGTLRAPHGVYFITGNHEYYSGAEAWCAHCEEALGWEVLLNDHRIIERGGARLAVVGVTDRSAGRMLPAHAPDLPKALMGTEGADLRILLDHQPAGAEAAAALGVDIQLSGHTHGGQIFPFTLLIHLAQRFVIGLHRVGGMWLYVNPGTTYWGPPMRLGAAQEITLLELQGA